MFEVTIRTDDQLALHKLMEFLKSLNLQGFKAPASNGKNSAVEVFVEPLKEKIEHKNLPVTDASDASVGATGKLIPAISFADGGASSMLKEKKIVQWGGMEVDISNIQPGFGCAKGMFEMSPDFDEPLTCRDDKRPKLPAL